RSNRRVSCQTSRRREERQVHTRERKENSARIGICQQSPPEELAAGDGERTKGATRRWDRILGCSTQRRASEAGHHEQMTTSVRGGTPLSALFGLVIVFALCQIIENESVR